MTSKPDLLWQRRWRRIASSSSKARTAIERESVEPPAVPLSVLYDIPCLVLLGSPGLGKSSEIQIAARDALARGEGADVIPLGRISGAGDLESRILTSARNPQASQKVWNIFLDGLDEALPQFTKDDNAIAFALRALAQIREPNTVRLRITCRSAEWPRMLESDFADFWGSASVQVYELQELNEADVELAASQFPPEQANRFLSQIERNEVDALTKRPVTLNMMLEVFARDSKLPDQRVQLYREALLASVSDWNSLRRDRRLDPQTKLMIAARIAVASVFSNSSEIWTGPKSEKSSERRLALSDISGGFEPTADESIAVGEAELNQALLTSLFSLVGDSLFVWSHQTFAEFLAAYYLIERRVESSKILEFLRSSPGSRIAPQLREVAAWLASMDPSFFSRLLEQEPDILLRSDIASASPRDREALVRELLLRYERAELHDFDFDSKSRYNQLGHPKLGDQLRPYIEGRDRNIVVRRVAIDIAEANDGAGLEDLLAEITLDPTEDYHIRTQAAAAIHKISNEQARLALRPLIEPNALDENDELKGYALRALWPKHLSVSEFLAALTPEKNSSWIGSYAFFLSSLEVPELTNDDISSVLAWILSASADNERSRTFDRAIPRLLDRVWDRANDSSVIRDVADFFLMLESSARYLSIQEVASDFFTRIGRSKEPRINLVREIIRNTHDNNWSWLAAPYPAHLVSDDDLPWLLEEVCSPSDAFPEEAAAQLIVSIIWRRHVNELDAVWDGAKKSALLAKGLESRFSCELASAISKFEREDFQRKSARKANENRERFDALRAIDTRLSAIEAGNFFAWWELNLVFLADERGQLVNEFSSDLTQTKVWSALSSPIRDRVLSTAEKFITETELQDLTWLGSNTYNRPAAAAYRAFKLILTLNSQRFFTLSPFVWKGWGASVLVSFNADDEESRKTIVQRAYDLAPETICRAVVRTMLKERSEYSARRLTRLFDHCFDERLGRLWWKLFNRLKGVKAADSILFYLARKDYPKVSRLLLRRMDGSESDASTPILTSEQLVSGISGLLEADPQHVWEKLVAFRARHEDLALDVIRALARNTYSDAPFISLIAEPELADFYIWTFRRIPPRSHDQGFRSVGPDEQIDHLRNFALRRLVALGTPAALAAVQRMATELPEADWLKYQVLDVRRAVDANTWKLREPSELVATIALWSPAASPRSTKAVVTAAAQQTGGAALIGSSIVSETEFQETIQLPPGPPPIVSRKFLLVATEWRSGHGGISTFNRELCLALAELGHQVACLVLKATPSEISDANLAKVRLIIPPRAPGTSSEDLSNLLRFQRMQLLPFKPEVVIGHDHITGLAGHHIACGIYEVPYVHFVHTLPEEIEKYKTRETASPLKGGFKSGIQTEQCKMAQLVVAVGPRIYVDFQNRLEWAGVPVIQIEPGLNRKLITYTADLKKPRRSDCLLVARLEDPVLKGAPIACRIITELNSNWTWKPPSRRPKLILRGFTPDKADAELAAIDGMAAAEEFVHCRPYTEEEDLIAGDICGASVVIMPSKQEGFGLTALEAIAAGIPTIITSESGLGELLLGNTISGIDPIAQKCVADVIGDTTTIVKDWANRIADTFNNLETAFEDAAKLRRALIPVLTWERAARTLSAEVEAVLAKSLA